MIERKNIGDANARSMQTLDWKKATRRKKLNSQDKQLEQNGEMQRNNRYRDEEIHPDNVFVQNKHI